MTQKTQTLHDQEILTDVLTDQKQATGLYNTYAGECMCQNLKSGLLDILRDEHTMQSSVFDQMHQRGWYVPPDAQQQMVKQAKQKFEGIAMQL